MVSRRDFFKGLGAAVAVAVISGSALSALIADPRVKAWALLDESEKIFKATGKSPVFLAKMDELLDHLAVHFKPSNPSPNEVLIRECGDMIKRRGKYAGAGPQAHWRTCYDSTFATMIIRDGFKNRKLPIIQAANWKPFAKGFTKIILAA